MKPEIELSNDIDYTDNPLHNADQIQNKTTQESDDVSVEVLKTQVEEKDRQIEEFKDENAEQKSLIEAKDSRIKELLNTIEDMKKKSNVEL